MDYFAENALAVQKEINTKKDTQTKGDVSTLLQRPVPKRMATTTVAMKTAKYLGFGGCGRRGSPGAPPRLRVRIVFNVFLSLK